MKILLDECLPARFSRLLPDHEVRTTPQAGWAGRKNGELLRLASKSFDVFITVDRNLAFQQNLSTLPLPVIVVHCQSNKLTDLEAHVPALREMLRSLRESRVYHIGGLRLA